jgi:hypothetical protein
MGDKYRRGFAALTCEMPGCGRRFVLRRTPEFPVCPECQEAARLHDERERQRAKRARLRASTQPSHA